ncbi:MAG TPA: elongation factor P [Anaerolineae bacterium]|nr:elongation factor P [Anaerolineae bacterium]
MIGVQDLRKSVTFELDGELYQVLDYHHHKPGRGNAIIRTKLRNLRTGATIERTFQSGDRVQDVRLDHATVQYLYHDERFYYFMNTETYEQPALTKEALGDAVNYLTDGLELELETYEGEPITIKLPTTVDLKVVEAEPGFAGDTASSATKNCVVETGLQVEVPLFIEPGDVIRVDTRSGKYITRV